MGVISQLLGILIIGISFTNLYSTGSSTIPASSSESLSADRYVSEDLGGGQRAKDSLVLVEFYQQSLGQNWLKPWDLTKPMTAWFGIQLDATGCVSCIDLDGREGCTISVSGGNGLSGVITPKIGELPNLKLLLLGNNRISGNIPNELFDLKKIKIIDVFANEMIGPLPANIGNATDLTTLSLAGNNLDGTIPPTIGGLINLEDLFLDNNRFTGALPPELGSANKLRRIRINNNQFNGSIPNEIGNLGELISINMAENVISGPIPVEIGNLVKLQDLILANNELSQQIPAEIGQLKEVARLRLCHNNLIGPLPLTIGGLVKLEQFWANDNNLIGTIPIGIGNCTILSDLRLDQNQLTGNIPTEIQELEYLRNINISQNKLIGPLPSDLSKLKRLQELIIYDNNLEGILPESIGDLSSIKIIRANDNKFIGPLPSSIVDLTRVKEISLQNNLIDGEIPEAYGQVASLSKLYLDNNFLTGCFPESLRDKCASDFIFTNNTELPWLGDFTQFCSGAKQVGAKCSTETGVPGETIQADCGCLLFVCKTINVVQDAFLCDDETISIAGQNYSDAGQVIHNLLDSNGCDSIITTNIVKLTVEVTTENTTCESESAGSARISTSLPGIFNYTLYDSNNAIVQERQQVSTLPEFTEILAKGSYSLVILENNMSCSIVKEFNIGADYSLIPTTQLEQIKCEGESLTLNGTIYNEANPSGTENLKSINGCDSLVRIELSYLSFEFDTENVQCENESNGSIRGAINLDLDDYSYTILDSDDKELSSALSSDKNFESEDFLTPGSYTLILNSPQLGCNYETSFEISAAYMLPPPTYEEYLICANEEIEIHGQVYSQAKHEGIETLTTTYGCDSLVNISVSFMQEHAVSDDEFIMQKGQTVFNILENDFLEENSDFDINIIEYEYVDDAFINENLELVVDINENFSGYSTVVYEICNRDCDQPCVTARAKISTQGDGYDEDILTPNDDGYNDVLVVSGYSAYETIPDSKINIINRWGQVVYTTTSYENDWQGNLNGNPNKPLPEGVYYYHLTYNTGKSVMGSRSLIR